MLYIKRKTHTGRVINDMIVRISASVPQHRSVVCKMSTISEHTMRNN